MKLNLTRPLRYGLLFGFVYFVVPPLMAQEPASVWNAISQAPFDPARAASVNNLKIARDAIHITLIDGTIQFTQPAAGVVYGAAFQGHGRVDVTVANELEQEQLRRFLGRDELAMEFAQATFSFTDDTFKEVSQNVTWTPASGDQLASLYRSRQREREEVGAEQIPRLFQGALSGDHKRTALFAADLKTSNKGWIHVVFDALDPEEIQVGRWADWSGFMGFETWLHFPAEGRSSSDAFRDPLRLADYDIQGYRIDATVTAGAELSATTRVHLTERIARERALQFGLDSNLRVDSVKDDAGTALPFFQAREKKDRNNSYGEYVAVVLPQATEPGRNQTLEFHYAGKHVVRKVGNGNYFCQSDLWYPESAHNFDTRSNFELTFHSPKQYTLVATGTKTGETPGGNTITTTWKSDKPLAVAGFAFGDYKVYSDKAGDVDVEVYANRQPDDFMNSIQQSVNDDLPTLGSHQSTVAIGTLTPSAMAKQIGVEVGNTIRVFESYYGPDPYPRIAVTNIPYAYGQGWPMLLYLSALSFLDSTQRNAFGIRDQLELTDFFRAHEVSHQWWGHRVGWKSYHDQWLSEGFAQFSGNLYVQYRESWKEYVNRLRLDREQLFSRDLRSQPFETAGPIWMGQRLRSADSLRAYDVVIYDKGGLVLNMLRMMLYDPRSQDPDARFKEMMKDFCQAYDNKAASTEDFKAIAEKHMLPTMDLDGNHRLDWFFSEYVYGIPIPHYSFSYSVQDAGGGKWNVKGSISRDGVPAGWKDILPIYMHTGGKVMRLGWLKATQKEAPFNVTLPMKPDKLSLNDNEDILADIKQ
jgi:Peptidase family M1 domain